MAKNTERIRNVIKNAGVVMSEPIAKKEVRKPQFKIIESESKKEFVQLVAEALLDGWDLVDFAVWNLSSAGNAWYYFQTLKK